MLLNYLKIALRNHGNNKLYTALNTIGLASGIAVALLIGLWLFDELSFNTYNRSYSDIAMVQKNRTLNGIINTDPSNCIPLAAAMRETYGNYFEEVVVSSYGGERTFRFQDKSLVRRGYFMEKGGQVILDLHIVRGSVVFPLKPGAILISEQVAKNLFGKDDPVGQVIRMDNKIDLKVEGVFQNLPKNSTFRSVHFYCAFDTFLAMDDWSKEDQNDWTENSFPIYVKLAPHADFDAASARIKNMLAAHIDDGSKPELFLQPMADWHLYPEFKNGKAVGLGVQNLWVFGLIGLFVLLLAAINFMNLSTARAGKRAREIGVRKAVGSRRGQLILQFYTETFLIILFAGMLGVAAAQAALPWFNEITGKRIVFALSSPLFGGLLAGFLLLTGLLAGSYPAFYLSSFKPQSVLKGQYKSGSREIFARKALVIFQFFISVTLIIATLIIRRQVQFAKDRPIGYDNSGLVSLHKRSPKLVGHYSAMRKDLLDCGAVLETAESNGPVTEFWFSSSGLQWKGKPAGLTEDFITLQVTPEFGKTIGWKMVQGRDFSAVYSLDTSAIILNESALRLMGLENPIDEVLRYAGKDYSVIGVAGDVVMDSPYERVKPTVFTMKKGDMPFMYMALNRAMSAGKALEKVESVLKKYDPGGDFNFKFTDAEFDDKFWREERTATLAIAFSGMAIFISLLGIFGLASFVAEQRTKEIGIRKVLGASVAGITGLLTTDFLKLVVIAFFIASPVAYYFMQQWLSDYAYRIELRWWMFAGAGLAAVVVAFLTVGFQSVKAAVADPVKSLRSE